METDWCAPRLIPRFVVSRFVSVCVPYPSPSLPLPLPLFRDAIGLVCSLSLSYLASRIWQIIRDLPCIIAILGVAKNRIDAGNAPQWVEALSPIIWLLGQPLVKLATSDELRSIENLCDMIQSLGRLVSCADPEISKAAGLAMINFTVNGKIRTLGEESGESMLQSSFSQRIVERCGVIPLLVSTLRDIDLPDVHLTIVKVFKAFSVFKENAMQIMAAGAAELLVTLLTEDFREPVVGLTIELLWNCLEFDHDAAIILGSWHTINTLKELIERILAHGCKVVDKELRNEALILLKLISHEKDARSYFQETAMVELLVHLATAHELGWGDSFVLPFFRLTKDEDFEAKQVILGILGQLSEEEEMLQYMLSQDLMAALLHHLDMEANKPSPWKEPQEEALQLQTTQMLFSIAPKSVQDFDEAGGFVVLMQLLEALPRLTKNTSASGLTSANPELQTNVLALTMQLASSADCREAMGNYGFLPPLLQLIQRSNAENHGTALRTDALSTVSLLCSACDSNQRLLRKSGGIPCLVPFLRYDAKDPNAQEKVVLAAVDAIWTGVATNPRSEAALFASGGVEELLALLETCPMSIRVQALGVIADLLLNPQSHPFVYEWRSECSGKNILEVIIDKWKDEETRLGHMCPNDVITDVQRPLLGVEPKGGRPVGEKEKAGPPIGPPGVYLSDPPPPASKSFPPAPPSKDSSAPKAPPTAIKVKGATVQAEDPTMVASTNDRLFARIASSDSKCKMYCILNAIDMTKFDPLSPEDQVKLPLIYSYMEFKESEVWHDIEKELDAEAIRPVTPDEAWLEARIEETEMRAMEVQHTQKTLVKDKEEVQRISEELFLEGIAENMHKDIAQTLKRGRAMLAAKKGKPVED